MRVKELPTLNNVYLCLCLTWTFDQVARNIEMKTEVSNATFFCPSLYLRCEGCESVLHSIEKQIQRANTHKEKKLKQKTQVEAEVFLPVFLSACFNRWNSWGAMHRRIGLTIASLLSKGRFWATTGSGQFYYFTCLHTTTFLLLGIFSLVETISSKIWQRLITWHAKCSLPVCVHGSKTVLA